VIDGATQASAEAVQAARQATTLAAGLSATPQNDSEPSAEGLHEQYPLTDLTVLRDLSLRRRMPYASFTFEI
jgi:hypothetical protein